jgi:hypothetical protein
MENKPESTFEVHFDADMNKKANFALPSQSIETNSIESFSVSKEKQIKLEHKQELASDFEIICDRNLLVTISTNGDERWVFENINDDIIICEIAAKVRDSKPKLQISPLELLLIGREIGKKVASSK